MSSSEQVILFEDEFCLTATIKPGGIHLRDWPFDHLPRPKRLPSHLTTWQALLTQRSVADRERCYALMKELEIGLSEMQHYMTGVEEREWMRAEQIRYERSEAYRRKMKIRQLNRERAEENSLERQRERQQVREKIPRQGRVRHHHHHHHHHPREQPILQGMLTESETRPVRNSKCVGPYHHHRQPRPSPAISDNDLLHAFPPSPEVYLAECSDDDFK